MKLYKNQATLKNILNKFLNSDISDKETDGNRYIYPCPLCSCVPFNCEINKKSLIYINIRIIII